MAPNLKYVIMFVRYLCYYYFIYDDGKRLYFKCHDDRSNRSLDKKRKNLGGVKGN